MSSQPRIDDPTQPVVDLAGGTGAASVRLPAGDTELTVRLHLSFGVRGWAPTIAMCIDGEDVVHIDPGPGQEMMVEGEALSNLVTLRAHAIGAPPAMRPIADPGAQHPV